MRRCALIALALLAACEVGPDYQAPEMALPQRWPGEATDATATAPPIPLDWWRQFNDPTLTALEEEGLKANDDIALAAARVAEARGILRVSEADLYPAVQIQGAAVRTGVSEERNFGGLGQIRPKPYNDFSLAAVLDYELDLWGRIRRANESARAQLLSEKANADAVRLAVASDIATGYFNLLAFDAQVDITLQTIESRKNSVAYQKSQFDVGVIDSLTFRQAEAELAVAEAALPVLQQARTEQMNALAILLGRSPEDMLNKPLTRAGSIAALPVPPAMPSDAPSTLLERRPDLIAAEQQLVAANAQIGVALSDYYPRITLSALIGLNSAESDRLFRSSARNWNVGANLLGPVIDAGSIGGNVDAAKARARQSRANYRQIVRGAFGEVTNALGFIQTSKTRAGALHRQVVAREDTLRVTNLRYEAGYSTHLELLDAQRFLFQAQLDEIDALRDQLSATVTLYKALGGGWNTQPPAKPTPPAEAPASKQPESPAPASAPTPTPLNDGTRAEQTPPTLPKTLPFARGAAAKHS